MVDPYDLLSEIKHTKRWKNETARYRVSRRWQFLVDEIKILLCDRINRHPRREWSSGWQHTGTRRGAAGGGRKGTQADVDREYSLPHVQVRNPCRSSQEWIAVIFALLF